MKSSFPRLQTIIDSIEKLQRKMSAGDFADFVTIKKAAEITGYTERAIRHKIASGLWPENVVWKWAPDGVQLIIMEGYFTWAKQLGRASLRGHRQSESSSGTRESDTLKH